MSDLRESGSIEQDADVVALLHREAYYHVGDQEWMSENQDRQHETELIIAKQRNGPTDVVKFTWDSRLTRFKSYASYPGGTGFSSSYAAPPPRGGAGGGGGRAPAAHAASDPFTVPTYSFSPGKKSGPVGDFRDGGGPDRPARRAFTNRAPRDELHGPHATTHRLRSSASSGAVSTSMR